MLEITKNTVLYVDPLSVNSIKSVLLSALSNPELRNEFAKKTKLAIKDFHWSEIAKYILKVNISEKK